MLLLNKIKIYFLVVFANVLLFDSCNNHVIYEHSIKNEFERLLEKQSQIEDVNNMAIITLFKLDTLNKNDFIQPDVKVKVVQSDSTSMPSDSNSNYDLLFCNYKYKSDTLFINLDYPYSNQSIRHIIYGNSVKTIFKEFYKNEKNLKMSFNADLKNELYIKTKTIKFKLDNSFLNVNKYLYGKTEIQTDSYYIKDPNFINGYMKKRFYIRYLFKIKK